MVLAVLSRTTQLRLAANNCDETACPSKSKSYSAADWMELWPLANGFFAGRPSLICFVDLWAGGSRSMKQINLACQQGGVYHRQIRRFSSPLSRRAWKIRSRVSATLVLTSLPPKSATPTVQRLGISSHTLGDIRSYLA